MPRRSRIKLAGMPQHIVQRGINREPCFFAEEDYYSYLHWLQKAAADWHCAIHAYVLMTNHVHLLVTPETETGTAKLMQAVGRRYVQYINRSYRRTGSLWEGRYKSSLIQAETYLLTCMRYIELKTLSVPTWCKTQANTAGAAIGITALVKQTHASHRTRSTSVLIAMKAADMQLTVAYSVASLMMKHLPTSGLPWHRGSHLAVIVLATRYVQRRESGVHRMGGVDRQENRTYLAM